METKLGYDYISQVNESVNNVKDFVVKGSGGRLVKAMLKRQEIFESNELSKLTKLKQITSWREYDLTTYSYGQKELLELRKIALKHTIQLVNGILKFDEVVKNGSNLDYSRTVDGFRADMRVVEKGFMLSVKDGDKTLLNVVVGCSSLLHATSWVKISDEVIKNTDFGLWRKSWGTSADTFEAVYKVKPNTIEPIKEKIRQEFVNHGLMTSVRGGHGWTVGNERIIPSSSTTHEDIICLHTMYYGLHQSEFQLALDIANEIIKSDGYTEKYER
ncbi:hypothetical protein P9X10_01320 [Bacillus cereus]|nr:hypothetical protein [Bacillus cereus]